MDYHPGMQLPQGRVPGKVLEALAVAARRSPVKHVLAKALRTQLGIEKLKAELPLTWSELRFGVVPKQAQENHQRTSEKLELPSSGTWPRTSRDLLASYRDNNVTPQTVVERCFAGARSFETRKAGGSPFLDYAETAAYAAAAAAKERLQQGKSLGPLDGVVIAIKEEVDVQGLPTRLGTSWLPSRPATTDCTAVRRLREAGAVIVGTTPMTEYGMSPLGLNSQRLMPGNAHEPECLPGGSSSGSAVAVALGLVPVALGADGGGSIRIPAAFNGIFGLKPTYGRIPLTGHGMVGGSTVVHLGPIATNTHDLAVFTEICAGACSGDESSLAQPELAPSELQEALRRGVRGLRIGIVDSEWSESAQDVVSPAQAALDSLAEAGAELVNISLPHARFASAAGYLTIGIETYANLLEARTHHMDELGADLQLLLANVSTFSPDDYLDAQRMRSVLRRELVDALQQVDVIALPTTQGSAPRVTDSERQRGFLDAALLERTCRYSFLANLTGSPAGTAPVGFDSSRMPVGLQLIGDAWDEACVLQVLAQLERNGAATVKRPEEAIDLLEKR